MVRVNVSFAISSARRNRVSRERDVIEFSSEPRLFSGCERRKYSDSVLNPLLKSLQGDSCQPVHASFMYRCRVPLLESQWARLDM